MRILYLDLSMGAAGDMLNAALYELLDDEKKQAYINKMNSLGLEGVEVSAEKAVKCGIVGTHMRVSVSGEEEGEEHHHHHHEGEECGHHHHHEDETSGLAEHEHHHEHEHEHEHHHGHHHHTGMAEIEALLEAAPVSQGVKEDALEVYRLIAEAESAAHGQPVEQIHFHEVGSMDALADVLGFCLLIEELKPDAISASPVCTGFGHVHCAHGVLPVPAPATARIMLGKPCYAGDIKGELLTPTGAALISRFVERFERAPEMTVEAIGLGMGRKDFPKANCVRALLGQTEEGSREEIRLLCCNLDDMTGERLGFAVDELLRAGALDAWWEAIGMKKGRPGVKLCALCRDDTLDMVYEAFFRHTTTLGVRETVCTRRVLKRSESAAETMFGTVRIKEAEGCGVVKSKYEYEDLARIARERGLALDEVAEMIDRGMI